MNEEGGWNWLGLVCSADFGISDNIPSSYIKTELIMRINWKVRVHNKYLLIQKLYV